MNHLQSNLLNKLPEKTNLTTERRKKEKTNDVIVVSLLKEVQQCRFVLFKQIFSVQLNFSFSILFHFWISITVGKHARHKDKERESDRRKRQWEEDKARRDWESQKRRDQARARSRRER